MSTVTYVFFLNQLSHIVKEPIAIRLLDDVL